MFEPVPPYQPSHFRIKFATSDWERAGTAALRRRVFCQEQAVFPGDDTDAVDARAIPICALSTLGGEADAVVGTVRIHADTQTPGEWWGSRLAVAADYRRIGALGAGLIHVAVASAHARGCTRFLAHVQGRNVALFEALHWVALDTLDLHGLPHALMQADLTRYPAMADPETGLVTLLRRAGGGGLG
ncbi:MSMEG_0567/Sll0786 family nitrogen starvation N-acetyltransferase [Methylobacterium sp. Leaf466]|uniref:MSMEG_0567/Sll0786 family nitrogen starvation N-acetyltransferase n=1 Tax=Methylobacterium sp. Leaf466 TaxID=1736386 RepID=UPI0006F58B63|nr:MSMEG_0567/Sll0786 family nitrogen starvation N-acetyltransferase [Methylobacterium sp. Leaf466]KQT78146.1 histone acetyltransferase [Methylobacterium sp. Leaf466]